MKTYASKNRPPGSMTFQTTPRRCRCGGTVGPEGECAACRAKRLACQRSEAASSLRQTAQAGQHDFARVPVYAQVPPGGAAAPAAAPSPGSTVDCTAADNAEIARARPIASAMVRKATRVIGGPPDQAVNALLRRYFNDDSASTLLHTLIGYRSLLSGITTNYTVECEKRGSLLYDFFCSGVNAYVRRVPWANVHLCEAAFGRGDIALAETLVHEASHKFDGTGDEAACWGGSCPTSLSRWDAYDNADSFSKFARDAYTTLP